MIYEYVCEKCGAIIAKDLPMKEDHPTVVPCHECQDELTARRVWGNQAIKIPESFQATSELYNGDHGSNLDYISGRMKHGNRISGKSKVYY